MAFCHVIGCSSRSGVQNDILFFTLPTNSVENPDPLKAERRRKWLRALNGVHWPKGLLDNVRVCSEHFITGKPALPDDTDHPDWIPRVKMPSRRDSGKRFEFTKVARTIRPDEFNQSLDKILTNTPEIKEEFDVPDYIILDQHNFDKTPIKSEPLEETEPPSIPNETASYIIDHDYLSKPVTKIDVKQQKICLQDHDYASKAPPFCANENLPFFCNICQKNHEDFFTFHRHMMDHTTQNDVTCPTCCQIFFSTSCLNNHLVTHSSMCDACGNLVPTTQLAAHQGFRPTNLSEPKKSSDNEKVYFCIACALPFRVLWEYLDHSMKVHNDKKYVRKLLYRCKKCGEVLVSKERLKQHFRVCGIIQRKSLVKSPLSVNVNYLKRL